MGIEHFFFSYGNFIYRRFVDNFINIKFNDVDEISRVFGREICNHVTPPLRDVITLMIYMLMYFTIKNCQLYVKTINITR